MDRSDPFASPVAAVEATLRTGLEQDPGGTTAVAVASLVKLARTGRQANREALKAVYVGLQSLLEAFDDGDGGSIAREFDNEIMASAGEVKIIPVPTPEPEVPALAAAA